MKKKKTSFWRNNALMLSFLFVTGIFYQSVFGQCVPIYTYTTSCGDGIIINDVKLSGENGTAINDLNTGCSMNDYDDKTATVAPVDLFVNTTYTLNIASVAWYSQGVTVWIDFNDDNVFDNATENVGTNLYVDAAGAVSLTIPMGVTIGLHRMRIMLAYNNDPSFNRISIADACNPPTNTDTGDSRGETHDYMVNIQPKPDCASTPSGGVSTSDVASTCFWSGFTLSTNASIPNQNGLSGIWQLSTDGVNWTDITGATNTTYSSGGIVVNTNYRYKTACSFSGTTSYSTVTLVHAKSETECYYQNDMCGLGYKIKNVTLNGESINLNNNSSCNQNNYENFTSGVSIPNLAIDSVYSLTISHNIQNVNYADTKLGAWIDFNNNGDFNDAGEFVGYINGVSGGLETLSNIQIPAGAYLGDVKMRVRLTIYGADPINPISLEQYGETEDYLVNIFQMNTCAGTPEAGMASAPSGICLGEDLSLSLTGASAPATGLSGVWQSSPAGANTWSVIAGANTYNYILVGGITSATDFRYILTCTSSSASDTSSVVTVSINAPTACYCQPTYSWGCNIVGGSYNIEINDFSLIGENNTSIVETGTGCSTNSYDDRTSSSVDLYMNTNYQAGIASNSNYGTENVAIWIDFNDNGQFESSEMVGTQTGIGSGNIVILDLTQPGVALGSHRMRVMLGQGQDPTTFDPCIAPSGGGDSFGEVHDYTVNILSKPVCSGTPNAGSVSDIIICPNVGFTISTSATIPNETGISSVWQEFDGTSWNNIAGANNTNTYNIAGGVSAPTMYRFIITCANSGLVGVTPPIQVTMDQANHCYYGEPLCDYGMNIKNVKLQGETVLLDNNSNCNQYSYEDFTSGVSVPDLALDSTYNLQGLTNYTYGGSDYSPHQTFGAWIDYDGDGVFGNNAQEFLGQVSGLIAGSGAITFTVPNTTTPGTYTMRVRMSLFGLNNPIDPVAFENDGETEDYLVKIINMPMCAGTPTAGIASSPSEVCAGSSFTLSLVGTDAPASGLSGTWQSSPAGANTWTTLTGASTYNYTVASGITNATDYRYVLTCSGSGISDTSNVVSVNVNALPVVNLGNETLLCSGSTITLNAGNAGSTYVWNNNSTNQKYVVTSGGTYSVVVTDTNGCKGSASIVIQQITQPLPVVALGADTAYCSGTAFAITLDAGNTGSTYIWNDNSPTQTLAVTGAGTYYVKVTNIYGCKGYDTLVVTENTLPTVTLGLDTAYCSGMTFALTLDAGNSGSTYTWNDNSSSQTLAVTGAGTYSVIVTDANGCIGKDTIIVTENALPAVVLGADTAICAGTTLTLDAGNAGAAYTWNGTAGNQTLDVTVANTYNVVVTDANGCVGKDTIIVSVNALPTIGSVVYSLGNDCSFDFGATTPANVSNYTWDFGDSQTASTVVASTSHTYTNTGTYTVTVKASNSCGEVTKTTEVSCEKVNVSEAEALESNLVLYPNPTSSEITIEVTGVAIMKTITVIDNIGKVIYQSDVNNTVSHQMKVSDLSNGLYTAIITTDKGNVMKKFEVAK